MLCLLFQDHIIFMSCLSSGVLLFQNHFQSCNVFHAMVFFRLNVENVARDMSSEEGWRRRNSPLPSPKPERLLRPGRSPKALSEVNLKR